MGRKQLILLPSKQMDKNRKESRNENGLIRMSKIARDYMGYTTDVEVYPTGTSTDARLNRTVLLNIFQAFSADLREARENGMDAEQLKRVGFVTTKMFERLTGNNKKSKEAVWITDDIQDTIIGADPEFLLFDKGNVIRANNVMAKEGPIGNDGAMAEVRPKPAIRPEELVENIHTIFNTDHLVSKIKDYDWKALCYFKDESRDYPVGGHIHIGNPVKIARMSTDNRINFFKSFNKILDEFLAIPMIKIDGAKQGKARRTECVMGKYGYFGEFRPCNGRLEYRTLSGMWLMHPKLATLVFGTAKAVIDEVYRLVAANEYKPEYMLPDKYKHRNLWHKEFDEWSSIPLTKELGCVIPSREMISTLNESSASVVSPRFLTTWHAKMKRLSTYNTYSEYIDGLHEVLKIQAKAFQDYDKDIKKNWLGGAEFLI